MSPTLVTKTPTTSGLECGHSTVHKLDQTVMNEVCRMTVQAKYELLVKNLDPMIIVDALYSKGVISEETLESVNKHSLTTRAKVRMALQKNFT